MERFEIHDNQFIKKNVISSLHKNDNNNNLPELITSLLENWNSENEKNQNGKYHETFGKKWNDCSKVNHYLCQNYRKVIKVKNYLQLIVDFLNVGDVLYALTIADITLQAARKAKTQAKESNVDVSTIDEFILSLDDLRYKIEHDNDLFQNVQRDGKLDEQLENVRKKIYKELVYKIDGVTALTKEIGTDNFIKYAIDQCYFFAPEIAQKQMQKIVEAFEDNDYKKRELYARHSIKKSEKYNGSNQDNVEDFDVEEKSTNNVSYHQTTDYYGTALAAAESAIKTYNGKSQDKENKIKNALALATLAKEKIQDDDKQVKAKDEINNAIEKIKKSSKIDQNVVQRWLEKNKTKIEEKLNNSKNCLFTSQEEDKAIEDYPILIDNDGNAKVRSVINEITGYTVSAGKENIFQNYRISHVWGRAFDPRYFTNLWNIVIVPSWANDLLDKPNAIKGTLESKLQSTIMKICEMLYFNDKCISKQDVQRLIMPDYPKIINENDVISSTQEIEKDHAIPNERIINKSDNKNPYLINIIEDKGSKTLGDIVKYAVYI